LFRYYVDQQIILLNVSFLLSSPTNPFGDILMRNIGMLILTMNLVSPCSLSSVKMAKFPLHRMPHIHIFYWWGKKAKIVEKYG